eukprot:TRINITY_DN989_c0_g2_i2.p1 TRINITY_DN989_c0_g2~~TRINITY_DN989_c0_g2_i2.p1  ORF type:complete len:138 (+),score=38.21 TRINITY_DN989_c0_g2_i2:153-566(+)
MSAPPPPPPPIAPPLSAASQAPSAPSAPPPPAGAAGRSPAAKKKWTVEMKEKTLDLSDESIPIANIQAANLVETAIAVKRSEEGSSGVLFVQTGHGLVVIKSGSKVMQELFGTRIAQRLEVLVPDTRIIRHKDSTTA